jgi:thiol-disulfide isomerase/thioredoxin
LSGKGDKVRGSFFNGDERVTSTGGSLQGDTLTLDFAHYATRLVATAQGDGFVGTYGNDSRYGKYPVAFKPHRAGTPSKTKAPDIRGLWILPYESSKGEKAFRFIVQQKGDVTSAAILRVDGDTGLLTGAYADGKFVLNHFDGARASVMEVVPRPDGQLDLSLHGRNAKNDQTFTAIRAADAQSKGLPPPSDFVSHTRVKNPNEPFQFSFPDLAGKTVANTDEKFKNKVLVVNITGSWCPNCHDEAPFLAELYKRYHPLGLEVVALDFEDTPEELQNPTRSRAFIQKYGIEYTYLLAGETDELEAKLPQAENLNSWPTTFFIGRDGKVRSVHAGFAAPASAEFHTQTKADITNTVERLLAE